MIDHGALARQTLNRSAEPVLWTTAEGRLLYANPAALQTLEWGLDDLLKLSIFDITPDLDPSLWKQLWKDVHQQGSVALELTHVSKQGRTIPIEFTAVPLAHETGEALCVYFHDMTQKKRLEELKNEFVSTVSHELRTPMTYIREGISQVLEGLRGTVNEEQKRALTVALMGIDRLKRMITDVLDISKIEAGKLALRRETVDFVGLVKETVSHFDSLATERGLRLGVEAPARPVSLFIDRDKTIQVLTNLLSNALKFTHQGGITITIEDTPTAIRCAVSDTGVGISEEDAKRLFKKFEQFGAPPSTGEKGTGLGLSICKGIIELHKGHIAAESRIGKGSTFHFTLPKLGPKDIFAIQLQDLIRDAFLRGATLSCLVMQLPDTPPSPTPDLSPVDHLEQVTRIQGIRRTDLLVKDHAYIYAALPNVVRKEAQRIADQIQKAYGPSLSIRLTCFPEDTPLEKEFLKKALPHYE